MGACYSNVTGEVLNDLLTVLESGTPVSPRGDCSMNRSCVVMMLHLLTRGPLFLPSPAHRLCHDLWVTVRVLQRWLRFPEIVQLRLLARVRGRFLTSGFPAECASSRKKADLDGQRGCWLQCSCLDSFLPHTSLSLWSVLGSVELLLPRPFLPPNLGLTC